MNLLIGSYDSDDEAPDSPATELKRPPELRESQPEPQFTKPAAWKDWRPQCPPGFDVLFWRMWNIELARRFERHEAVSVSARPAHFTDSFSIQVAFIRLFGSRVAAAAQKNVFAMLSLRTVKDANTDTLRPEESAVTISSNLRVLTLKIFKGSPFKASNMLFRVLDIFYLDLNGCRKARGGEFATCQAFCAWRHLLQYVFILHHIILLVFW